MIEENKQPWENLLKIYVHLLLEQVVKQNELSKFHVTILSAMVESLDKFIKNRCFYESIAMSHSQSVTRNK
jgi:hypothetical protein